MHTYNDISVKTINFPAPRALKTGIRQSPTYSRITIRPKPKPRKAVYAYGTPRVVVRLYATPYTLQSVVIEPETERLQTIHHCALNDPRSDEPARSRSAFVGTAPRGTGQEQDPPEPPDLFYYREPHGHEPGFYVYAEKNKLRNCAPQ